MKFITNKGALGHILMAYLFLFAVSDVRGQDEIDSSGEESGDGSGDGSGINPEGSGTGDVCEDIGCENVTDKCTVKQLCMGGECQDVPECEADEGALDQSIFSCRRRNEAYQFCGTKCEPTCDNQHPVCIRGCLWFVCQCIRGYVRDRNGDCVRPWQCPKKCGRYEELKRCGTSCEATCRNQNPSFCRPCQRNVCQCKDGYVRSRHGNCIPKWWCRRG